MNNKARSQAVHKEDLRRTNYQVGSWVYLFVLSERRACSPTPAVINCPHLSGGCMRMFTRLSFAALFLAVTSTTSFAQYSPESFSAMQWRLVGPHRAGRVTAVAGIPGKPAVYYFGTPGGGVWKTVNGGRVWQPIFDDAHVASIGALALAPSNPEIIYVGTGEETVGNG